MSRDISNLERDLAMEMCKVLHIEWSRATYQWAVRFLRENANRLALLKMSGECAAQGIEAGTATTVKQGVVHESPVAESDAPKGGLP